MFKHFLTHLDKNLLRNQLQGDQKTEPTVPKKFWASMRQRRDIDRDEQWFQQDNATPHTSNDPLACLRERFQERLIIKKCDVKWAPHTPDMNPVYSLLGGIYLKGNVYRNNLQTIGEQITANQGNPKRAMCSSY